MAMAEYIERDLILDTIAKDHSKRGDCEEKAALDIWDSIKKIPAADVVEVRRGEWQVNVYGQHKNFRDVICPICGVNFACHTGMLQLQRFSYCPNCGAKMDGKGEGE